MYVMVNPLEKTCEVFGLIVLVGDRAEGKHVSWMLIQLGLGYVP